MTREELERVRAWADNKIATGGEPPWAWYQYWKLRETMDAILGGMDAVVITPLPPEDSPQSAPRRGSAVLRVVSECQQDTAQLHCAGQPVRLPM